MVRLMRPARRGLACGWRGTAIDSLQLLGVIEDHDDAERLIRSALETLETELQAIGVECETKMRRGHAAEQILDEAAEWQADLIVIGQLGRRGLTRFIMGGTATRIVQYARCSVLLVKGPAIRPAQDSGLHGGRRARPARCGSGRPAGRANSGRGDRAARHVAGGAYRKRLSARARSAGRRSDRTAHARRRASGNGVEYAASHGA